MNEKLLAVLGQLDTSDDAHWTADGQARLDVVEKLLGEDTSRDEIQKLAPTFSRTTPLEPAENNTGGPNTAGDPSVDTEAEGTEAEEKAVKDAELALAKARKKVIDAQTKVEEASNAYNDAVNALQKAQGGGTLVSDIAKFRAEQLKLRTRKVKTDAAVKKAIADALANVS